MSVRQGTQFVQHDFFGFGGMHATINIKVALVGDGVERGRARADIGHGNRARAKKWVWSALQFLVQLLHALYKGNCLVQSVIAAFGRTGMTTAPLKGNADLGTATMAAINFHVGRFAYHYKIRTNTLVLNQRITGNAVAPLFHVAKIIERPILRQSQLFQRRQRIDHWRGGALFVASAKTIDNSILEFTLEGVPLPLARVSNTDRINMAIVEQGTRPTADTSQDVTHGVAAYFIEAELGHTSAYSISNRANLAVIARYGDQVTQELYHAVMVLCQFLLHSLLCFTDAHKRTSPTTFAREHARVLVPGRVYALHRV